MRYQRTGRAGANTCGCKVSYSDRHNERQGKKEEIPTNPNTSIRPEQTKHNTTWKAADVPSLWRLDQAIRKDYANVERTVTLKDGTKHTRHREMPSKGKTAANPIKETILILPTNGPETDAMVEEFARQVEKLTGWRCIRRYTHRDERYDDPDTGEQHYNCHSHLVWDCYNWQTHDIRKVGKPIMRQIQDIAAEVTGMERGIDARVTKAEHLTVATFKNEQERQRAEDLKAQNLALQKEVAATRKQLTTDLRQHRATLAHLGKNMVTKFDQLAKKEEPTQAEKESRDLLAEEYRKQAATTDKELRSQTIQLHKLLDSTAAAIHALTDRIIKKAKAAKRSLAAAGLRNRVVKFIVPSADLREVASIDEMQAQKEEAEQQARISALNAENAKHVAEKAKETANLATAAANERERKAKELQESLQEKIINTRTESYKAGAAAKHKEWEDWYQRNNIDNIINERDNLQNIVTDLKQQLTNKEAELQEAYDDHTAQAVNTAKMLIRKWGASPFEQAGLEFTSYESWQTAKKECQQEQQRQQQRKGMRMG